MVVNLNEKSSYLQSFFSDKKKLQRWEHVLYGHFKYIHHTWNRHKEPFDQTFTTCGDRSPLKAVGNGEVTLKPLPKT